MDASSPTVSILIPTYYRNDLLREAVESALDQTYEPIEVIVIDDSGEQHAAAVVDEFDAVTYLALDENVGENQAREAGLEEATGEYVQFLDDDDLLRSDKLSEQVQQLDDETGVVYCGLRYYERGDVILPDPDVRGNVLKQALAFSLWPPCFTSTLLIDRDVLEAVRPLRHHGAGDTTFLIGLAQRTEFDFVAEPLVEKRIQVDSLGFTLDNVANKRQLLSEYETLYSQYPTCRAAALTHINSHAGHIRLEKTVWTPTATLAFGRAAYHAPADRASHIATFLGSMFGRPGLRAVDYCRRLVTSYREVGPWKTASRARQALFSQ